MKTNPIELVKEITFSSSASRQLGFSGMPNGLSLSPNGQHLLINSEENIYHFDLDQPGRGWQDSFDISDINKVAATDSGGAWILTNEQVRLLKMDSNGVREYPVDSVEMIWGNDNWLITHDNSEKVLTFVSLDDHLIHMVKFNKVILHAWKHGNQFRMLAISEHGKRIYLYEWACNKEKPVLKNSIQYAGIIGIPGMRMDYTFTKHVHAWPNQDGSLSIKLLPWAVIVTADGCLHINEDNMAWTPVIHSDSPLSRLKLAELSAHALDDGLARPAGYCSEPYLITTLQTEDHVHIISTLWHKKIPIDLIDALEADGLMKNLENEDVAEFLLTACDDEIPPLKSMAGLVLSKLDDIRSPAQVPALLKRRKAHIEQLFQQVLPSALHTFIEDTCSSQADSFTDMHSLLEKLDKMPSLVSIFFAALDDHRLTYDERHALVARCLRRIIHVLPGSVRSRAPAHLVQHALSLRKSILYAEPAAAAFLIEKAPPHFFSPENMMAIFEHFPTHSEVINSLFARMEELKKRLNNLSASEKAKLSKAISHTINTQVGHQYVLNVYSDNIEFPFNINRSYLDILELLQDPAFQIQPLVEAMADHANDKNRRFCGFLNTALEHYGKHRLI
ncbi:MAG: hypothetical protein Q9M17_10605, partial [Mariprofundus sp.]|nr:hypothetical protein [Mariprofundus sp.]